MLLLLLQLASINSVVTKISDRWSAFVEKIYLAGRDRSFILLFTTNEFAPSVHRSGLVAEANCCHYQCQRSGYPFLLRNTSLYCLFFPIKENDSRAVTPERTAAATPIIP